MTKASIDRIDPTDLGTIAHVYNHIFRPGRTEEEIRRRMRGRIGILALVARVERDAVGFYLGMELKPSVHFAWMVGVVNDLRRTGVATQLMGYAEDWATAEGYRSMRFECDNRIRPMLHFGIAAAYDVVGIRWDPDRLTNLIIFEKTLTEARDPGDSL